MNNVTFPSKNIIAKQVTELVEVNGQQIPKHLYMMHMNRKQKRQFEAEIRKKNSKIKIIRVENNFSVKDNIDIAEVIEENSLEKNSVEENILIK